jgi:hypothetical protein
MKMKHLLFVITIIAIIGGFAMAQTQTPPPDPKYMLPGVSQYYQNAANDALLSRAYALQCLDKLNGPTPGPDDSYYTGD